MVDITLKAIEQLLDRKLEPIVVTLDAVQETVSGHTEKLDKLQKVVSNHTEILVKHSEKLDNLEKMVSGHTEILNSHTKILDGISKQLVALSQDKAAMIERLDRHEKIIEALAAKLNLDIKHFFV